MADSDNRLLSFHEFSWKHLFTLSARRRTSQETNEPEGKCARGQIIQGEGTNQVRTEQARGQMSQRAKKPRGETARRQNGKGVTEPDRL